jgi:hypothetical protein
VFWKVENIEFWKLLVLRLGEETPTLWGLLMIEVSSFKKDPTK